MIKLWSSKCIGKSICFGLDNLERLEELRLDVKARLANKGQVSVAKAEGIMVIKGRKEDETATQEETESQPMGAATPVKPKTAEEPSADNALEDAMLWLYKSDELDLNDLFRYL